LALLRILVPFLFSPRNLEKSKKGEKSVRKHDLPKTYRRCEYELAEAKS